MSCSFEGAVDACGTDGDYFVKKVEDKFCMLNKISGRIVSYNTLFQEKTMRMLDAYNDTELHFIKEMVPRDGLECTKSYQRSLRFLKQTEQKMTTKIIKLLSAHNKRDATQNMVPLVLRSFLETQTQVGIEFNLEGYYFV